MLIEGEPVLRGAMVVRLGETERVGLMLRGAATLLRETELRPDGLERLTEGDRTAALPLEREMLRGAAAAWYEDRDGAREVVRDGVYDGLAERMDRDEIDGDDRE